MNTRHLIFILGVLCMRALAAPAQDELICHTSDVTECYPRIFRPTNEFQVVRDDQHIPKGLHVRLNFQTGLKEAKLYDPSKDTDPVNAVEVVPEDAVDEPYHRPSHDDHTQKILAGMKQAAYGGSGSIKPPPASGGDAKTFHDNTGKIREYLKDHDNNNEDAARAFGDLDELCHDIYWGLQLIKDTPTLSALYDAITYEGSHANPWTKWAKSASLLGTALQNNKAALTVFHGFVKSHEANKPQQKTFIDTVAQGLSIGPVDAKVHTTYLISKLLQNDDFLADFLAGTGLHNLNNGLGQIQQSGGSGGGSGDSAGGSDHDKLNFKKKAANLVGDYVLVVDEARERLVSLHEPTEQRKQNDAPGSTPASAPLPTKLVTALADRKAWCEVFDVAFGIWRFGVNGNKKMPNERERWSFVPRSCDSQMYDVGTGEMLPAARASLEREL